MWQITLIITTGIIVAIIGISALWLGFNYLQKDNVTQRLQDFVADPMLELAPRPTVNTRRRQLTGSFVSRTFLPSIKNLGRAFGRLTPRGAIDSLSHQLLVAGNPFGLGAREFFGLSIASTILGFLLAMILIRRGFAPLNLALTLMTFVFMAALPTLWLRGRMQYRQNNVRRGLPDALDMLSVCATAGLGFDQSLMRVSEHWNTPIGQEFGRVISEMEMGLSRRDALRNLAERVDVQELSSFIAFVLQSEQLGMSLSETLHSQAGQMRIERRFKAQEQAQKIPSKMLFPMALLIFPAILAVVLGPAIPQIVEVLGNL